MPGHGLRYISHKICALNHYAHLHDTWSNSNYHSGQIYYSNIQNLSGLTWKHCLLMAQSNALCVCVRTCWKERQEGHWPITSYDPPSILLGFQGVYRREQKVEFSENDFNAEVLTPLIPIFHWPEALPNIKGLRKLVAVSRGKEKIHFCYKKQGLHS